MSFTRPRNCCLIFTLVCYLIVTHGLHADELDPVNFSREIRSLLSDTCFQCHGPDEQQRVSDFRLDTKEGAFTQIGDAPAIVAGDSSKSELIRRITSNDPDDQMPPPDADRRLSDRQIQLLSRWIDEVLHGRNIGPLFHRLDQNHLPRSTRIGVKMPLIIFTRLSCPYSAWVIEVTCFIEDIFSIVV